MWMLKISYTWSCLSLLPDLLCLLLFLAHHTVLQELGGSSRLPKYHRHIHRFVLVCSELFCFDSVFFSALWRTRLNRVADRPSPCLTPFPMLKRLLIFPSTITLAWAPSRVICTSHSIFLGIPKLSNVFKSLF